MAFKMNRPVIKGTAQHKASIAKAKAKQIVSQRRTTADASLIEAANMLGKSNISESIDYSIDMPEIKVPKINKKKKDNNKLPTEKMPAMETETTGPDLEKRKIPETKQKKVKKKKVEVKKVNDKDVFNRKLNLSKEQDIQSDLVKSISEKDTKNIKVRKEGDFITKEDIRLMNEKAKQAAAFDPSDVRAYTKEEQARLTFDERTNEMRLPEEIAADKTVYSTDEGAPNDVAVAPRTGRQRRLDKKYKNSGPNVRANMIKDGYVPPSDSPAQKRDDRIFSNALPNGVLRKNMINSGYIPRNQR